MAIDNTIVKKVGKLAKIKIEQSEEKKLIQELNNILDWVDELNGGSFHPSKRCGFHCHLLSCACLTFVANRVRFQRLKPS